MSGLIGADELKRKLERLARGMLTEAGKALTAEAKTIERKSRERTPVDTGALRDTHRVSEPEIRGGVVSVAIGVGDSSTPYAVAVHERMEATHPSGQPKFLQSAAFDAVPSLSRKLGKQISLKRAMR